MFGLLVGYELAFNTLQRPGMKRFDSAVVQSGKFAIQKLAGVEKHKSREEAAAGAVPFCIKDKLSQRYRWSLSFGTISYLQKHC